MSRFWSVASACCYFCLKEIQKVLHFTIHDGVSDIQIIHELLRRAGVRVKCLGQFRTVSGHEGQRLRVYGLDTDHWAFVAAVIDRRFEREQEH